MFQWHIITGEYPPQPGGVSDYTHLVARALAKAGDEVEVWAPACPQPQHAEAGIQVHRLPGHCGPRTLAIIDRAIAGANAERVLVQYVPHAFGFKAMNLPFSYWLYARRHLLTEHGHGGQRAESLGRVGLQRPDLLVAQRVGTPHQVNHAAILERFGG